METDIVVQERVLSVTELSLHLKKTIESQFKSVRLRGEISAFKRHSSGHAYFCLKDEESVIDAICWRGTVSQLSLIPEDGLEVICQGRITTYGARSKYQMIVESMELAGMGSLLKLLQDRKEKLAKEGLFDPTRKKPLPFIPQKIGIITSATGAVIQDILHRISERFPCHVILWPVTVQGPTAAGEITDAIEGFNKIQGDLKPDLLIVARGGGSLEDLWCFNEENVVRAAAASHIPLISAVGHETDTTLIDFASDRRAPTPTAAAEMATPVRLDLIDATQTLHHRLNMVTINHVRHLHTKVQSLGRGLISPKQSLEIKAQTLDDRCERLMVALTKKLQQCTQDVSFANHRLSQVRNNALIRASQSYHRWAPLLESYSYEKTLARGFAMVKDPQGKPITSAQRLKLQETAHLQFSDGGVSIKPLP
ncbi:MAG: exodeoxyribonuclease VII large subunit [Alphaproteobacteria bacterium]